MNEQLLLETLDERQLNHVLEWAYVEWREGRILNGPKVWMQLGERHSLLGVIGYIHMRLGIGNPNETMSAFDSTGAPTDWYCRARGVDMTINRLTRELLNKPPIDIFP